MGATRTSTSVSLHCRAEPVVRVFGRQASSLPSGSTTCRWRDRRVATLRTPLVCERGAGGPSSTRGARPRRSGGGSSAAWWAGGVDGAVREPEGELAVGAEFDHPSVVVDLGVVHTAHREQIVEIGGAAVPPPDDVVEFATVVADGAPRDATALVEPAECSALRPVGKSSGATEVQLAGRVEHDTVADDNGVHVGVGRESGEYPGRELDGDRELGDRAVAAGGIG